MITYYSLEYREDAEPRWQKTKVATFELQPNGVVRVDCVDPRDEKRFRQVLIGVVKGRPLTVRPEDGQRYLDGLLELNSRSRVLVVDE